MKNNIIYLKHISDAIAKIERYLAGASYESFIKNDMMISAVIREMEIIGEAANKIDYEFQKKYPKIPWQKMISMRNFLIHEYFGVNTQIVWDTCMTNLKDLKVVISSLLDELTNL